MERMPLPLVPAGTGGSLFVSLPHGSGQASRSPSPVRSIHPVDAEGNIPMGDDNDNQSKDPDSDEEQDNEEEETLRMPEFPHSYNLDIDYAPSAVNTTSQQGSTNYLAWLIRQTIAPLSQQIEE